MKFPKLLISLLALGLMAAAPLANAADGGKGKGGRGGNPDQMVARIDEAVQLTADQKTKIKEIITANMEKARDAQQDERRTIMQAQHDQIRAVLTPEQQKKYDDMPAPARGGKKKKDQ